MNHKKELIKLIQQLSHKYGSWQVFEDFLAMSAYSISNSVDWVNKDKRELQYMEIVGKYEKKELDSFPKMFYHLIEELERNVDRPKDVLGPIFHELELHNKYKGQFFTPQHVCDMMGMITAGDNLPERGFHSVYEPCTGSGAMILGLANALKKGGFHFQQQMVVFATDIDIKCVWMTYLQLSLYGIPAVITHGNSLTVEEWSRWYTPVYLMDGWLWRQQCSNTDKPCEQDELFKCASEPMYAAMKNLENLLPTEKSEKENIPIAGKSTKESSVYDIKLHEIENGQLTFGF